MTTHPIVVDVLLINPKASKYWTHLISRSVLALVKVHFQIPQKTQSNSRKKLLNCEQGGARCLETDVSLILSQLMELRPLGVSRVNLDGAGGSRRFYGSAVQTRRKRRAVKTILPLTSLSLRGISDTPSHFLPAAFKLFTLFTGDLSFAKYSEISESGEKRFCGSVHVF